MNINKLIIGTANFSKSYGFLGSRLSLNVFKKICKEFKKSNYTLTLDTAISYKNAHKIISKVSNVKLKLITKLPMIKKKVSLFDVRKMLNKDLHKFNQKKFYAVLIHNTNILKTKNGKNLYKFLLQLKKEKLITKVGFSIYDGVELKNFYKKYKPEIIQLPINLFNQKFLENGWLKKLKKDQVEVHVRSIFLQGVILSTKNKVLKNNQFKNHFLFFKNWLKKNKINAFDASLNFISQIKYLDKIVIGINNFKQFKEILNFKTKKRNFNFGILKSNNQKLINPTKW